MIPLFKSQFSIGKSILTVDDIVNIAKSKSLKEVVCVEDSFFGFRSLKSKLSEEAIKFIFGIRLSVVQDSNDSDLRPSKLVFFAKNNEGIKAIRSLYTDAHTSDSGSLSLSNYKKSFFKDVKVAVPFYDSFIYNNIFMFGLSELSLDGIEHTYLVEDNNHPFDFQIKRVIDTLGVETTPCKSIYYKSKEDFHAFQMHKAICSRRMGRSPTFSSPNLNDFASDEFCMESYVLELD
jgi:DNA polymerase III alpha subunit